jgi:hypothetical protein
MRHRRHIHIQDLGFLEEVLCENTDFPPPVRRAYPGIQVEEALQFLFVFSVSRLPLGKSLPPIAKRLDIRLRWSWKIGQEVKVYFTG